MEEIRRSLKRAEDRLNSALKEIDNNASPLAIEFREINLQIFIFQYDICYEMSSFILNNPQGFSASVALKGLVLRIFEYDMLLNKHLIPRFLKLAKERNVPINSASIKKEKELWKAQLKQIKIWYNVRNKAAGHYASDIYTQIELLKTLEVKEVMAVTHGFLSFNLALTNALKDVGRSNVT